MGLRTDHPHISVYLVYVERMYYSKNLPKRMMPILFMVNCQVVSLSKGQIVMKRLTKICRSTVICFAQQSAQSTLQFKFNHTLLYNMAFIKPTAYKIEWERV